MVIAKLAESRAESLIFKRRPSCWSSTWKGPFRWQWEWKTSLSPYYDREGMEGGSSQHLPAQPNAQRWHLWSPVKELDLPCGILSSGRNPSSMISLVRRKWLKSCSFLWLHGNFKPFSGRLLFVSFVWRAPTLRGLPLRCKNCLELGDRHCLNLTLSPLLLFRTRSPRKRTIALPPHNQLTDPLIVENIWWLVGQGLAQPFSWTWTWWVSIWRERFLLLTQHWSWGIFRFLACSGRNELVA